MTHSLQCDESVALTAVRDKISAFSMRRAQVSIQPTTSLAAEIDEFLGLTQAAHAAFGGSDTDILPIDADVPRAFTGDQLLRSVEANAELLGVSEYVETMLMRIRTILSDSRMKTITGNTDRRDAA
jgi:hypothetical protein